mgnify:CR=1 FL=1
MRKTMRTTMLLVPSDESDLPLFDDVKKGESYLLRDIFCVLLLFGHVFLLCFVDMYLFLICIVSLCHI